MILKKVYLLECLIYYLIHFYCMKIYKCVIESIKKIIFNDSYIGKYYINKQTRSKYSLNDILIDILYVLKTGIAWRDLRSHIKWTSVYWHFKRFTKRNIFKKMFLKMRNKAIKNTQSNILLIDTSFICNKYGINNVSRNKFNKNKKCNKLSCVTDEFGVPFSICANKGTLHDIKFFDVHYKDLSNSFSKNKYKYLLADKAYFSADLRNKLIVNNCNLMVPNKKNSNKQYPFNKNIYKKRINVEHLFSKIKSFRRIAIRYDKLFDTYMSFVYMGFSLLLFRNQ